MTNGLFKGRTTVFLNNGNIAYQGFNSPYSNKVLGYVRIDNQYTNMSEYNIDFKVTEETLLHFAEQQETACKNNECNYNNESCFIQGCGGYTV
jgi:hypothetical protein